MSGLKRVLSRKASRQQTDAAEPQERPSVPRLPSFKESRYEDAAQGAQPVVGLMPLRGNRMFAVRHEDSNPAPAYPTRTSSLAQDEHVTPNRIPRKGVHSLPDRKKPATSSDFNAGQNGGGGLATMVTEHIPRVPRLRRSSARPHGTWPHREPDNRAESSWQDQPRPQSDRVIPISTDGAGILKTSLTQPHRRQKSVSFVDGTRPTELNFDEYRALPSTDKMLPDSSSSPQISPSSVSSWTTADDGEPDFPFDSNTGKWTERESSQLTPPISTATVPSTYDQLDHPEERDSGISIGSYESKQEITNHSARGTPGDKGRHSQLNANRRQPIDLPLRVVKKGKDLEQSPAAASGQSVASSEEVLRRAQYSSTDTTVYETVAPAVTHETVTKKIHHIREERIYREIHNYDIYHRVLPVVDVQVLPPRHFKVQNDELVEMHPDEVPQGRKYNWLVAETISTGESSGEPRNFTARDFSGNEGEEKSYITPEGFPRTETTWIHPPQLESGGRESGQTIPVEF